MKKILVVEDNPDVRENLEEILELSDYEVLSAENGKTGVDLALEHKPDLILCDVMMPQLDGFGVLRILSKRPETADIPFIFLTAKSEKSDFRKGMNLGADDYIVKPFDDVVLLDAIELRLKKSERLRQQFDGTKAGLDHFFNEIKGFNAFQELSKDRENRTYQKKDQIFEEGGYPHQVFFIESGSIKLCKTNEFGKELIIDILKPGDFLGYIPIIQNTPYTESAEALETCKLSIIPKDDFLQLLYSNTNVAAQLIKMLANNIVDKEAQLLNLAYNSVRKKIADALLRLSETNSGDGPVTIRIKRENLGNMTGTAKETVIRTLSEFKSDGLVEINGSEITILQKQKLATLPY